MFVLKHHSDFKSSYDISSLSIKHALLEDLTIPMKIVRQF